LSIYVYLIVDYSQLYHTKLRFYLFGINVVSVKNIFPFVYFLTVSLNVDRII